MSWTKRVVKWFARWSVELCFLLYPAAYAPLIHLSNHSGLPPLQILPVSTVSCLLFSLLIVSGFKWWPNLRLPEGKSARRAAMAAVPATAAIMLMTPATYALVTAAQLLSTLTLMKVTSIGVAIPTYIAGSRAGGKVKLAAGLCMAVILTATFGVPLWKLAHGGGWTGPSLGWPVVGLSAGYGAAYAQRLLKMGPYKHSMPFFVTEHVGSPPLALLFLGFLALVGLISFAIGHPLGLLLDVAEGFTLWTRLDLWALGFFSQVVGLAGGWILVGRKLSAAAMTLNRCAALIAGAFLVVVEGGHFRPEHAGALVVPLIVGLIGRTNREAATTA